MNFTDILLPEFDHEMSNTRKTLERIPESRFSWRPHDKSYTLGTLAAHIANLPSFVTVALGQDSFDLGMYPSPAPMKTRKDVLAAFDSNVKAARTAISCATNEVLMRPWALLHGTATVFTIPKVTVLRSFVMNHLIHHRAQLSVYLRLNNIPVPALYGPSADEQ